MKKENNKATLKWIYCRIKRFLPFVAIFSLISVVLSLSLIGIAILSKNIFDIATNNGKSHLLFYGVVILGIIIFQIVLNGAHTVMLACANGKLTMSLRKHLFAKLFYKKYDKITGYHSGDILNRITSDVDVLVSGVFSIIPNTVSMLTKIIAGALTMFLMEPKAAILVLLIGVIFPAIGRFMSKRYKYIHKECQQTEGKSRSFMQECFENIVVIKTFIKENPFSKKLENYLYKNYRFKIKRAKLSAVTHLSLYSFFTLGYYGIMLWGAAGIAAGTMTYGTMMAFLQLVAQLRAPLQNVSGIMPQYYSAIASAERLMELENIDDEPPLSNEDYNEILNKGFKTIDINNICFSYDDEEILENCSFTAHKGKITAITGGSGSGKSTLFKLILGLYEAQAGDITIDGKTKIDASLRGLFAYVPQRNMILSGTIRENLTLCNGNITDEELEKATRTAEIFELINSLPNGFETQLSERGEGLSEGQLQRISIARALLTDAPILLLDEATAALDEKTESKVLANIKKLTDKTVIFITHRNTSLDVCDSIVNVNNKKIEVIK